MYLNKSIRMYLLIYILTLLIIPIVSPNLKIIFIPILIMYIFLLNKYENYKKDMLLIVVLITPLSGLKSLYTLGLDFSQMFIFVYIINEIIKFIIKKKYEIKIGISFIDKLFYLITIIILFSFITSDVEFKIKFTDFRNYIIIVITYFIFRDYKNLNRFLNIVLIGITICSSITLIIYFFADINSLGLLKIEGRYTWGYQTLYPITIPFTLFNIFNKQFKRLNFKISLEISFIIQIISIIMGQNRTGIILTLLNIAFVCIYILFRAIKYKEYLNISFIIILSIVSIIIFTILINIALKNNNILIMRFMDIVNNTGTMGNLVTRSKTNSFYLNDLVKNIWGHGIGSKMYMYNQDNSPYQLGFFIDNAFLTIGYKMGILPILTIALIIIISLINLLKYKNIQFIHLYSVISIFVISIAGGMMTAQILNNNAVSLFFWALISIIIKNRGENRL